MEPEVDLPEKVIPLDGGANILNTRNAFALWARSNREEEDGGNRINLSDFQCSDTSLL